LGICEKIPKKKKKILAAAKMLLFCCCMPNRKTTLILNFAGIHGIVYAIYIQLLSPRIECG